jgi:hypothetical protein
MQIDKFEIKNEPSKKTFKLKRSDEESSDIKETVKELSDSREAGEKSSVTIVRPKILSGVSIQGNKSGRINIEFDKKNETNVSNKLE